LTWNRLVRQTHRWLSTAFSVVAVIIKNTVAQKRYTAGLGLSAVFVLALQFFTGMYLFVLPYAAKWRSGSPTDTTGGPPGHESVS